MSRQYIAETLKRLRENSGMTADEVGAIVGKSGKTVNAWENNRGQPDAEMLMKLCDIYNVDNILSEFNPVKKSKNQNGSKKLSQDEEIVIDKYRKLDSGGQKVVSTVIDIELSRIKSLKTSKPRPIPYYNVYANATEPKPEPKTISLPMYDDMYASAGYGEYMDYTTCSAVNVGENNVPPGADFIVKVAGDSMEPEIPNGCKIYVKQDSDVHPGEIGLFQISNNLFVKKCTDDGLISLNDKYDPIKYDGTESIVCVGKFLGIVDDDDIM